MRAGLQNLLLAAGSVALCCGLLEVGYRIHLSRSPFHPLDPPVERFTASASVYGHYDREAGVRYLPGSAHHVLTVTVEGRVPWAPELPISRTNEDGFMGKTRRAEYDAAALRLVVYGDSFTHWSQAGETWPDLLEAELRAQLGIDVRVLNLGRGGYGVLQMVDLAAATLPALKPDLALVAFISDDVTRARWWTRTATIGGYVRPLLSPSATEFGLALAADEYVVNPAITPAWVAAARAQDPSAQPLVDALVAQYLALKRGFMAARGLRVTRRTAWTLTESFLWNRLTTGLPFADDIVSIPRVELTHFAEDARFVASTDTLRGLGVPVHYVHLPAMHELRARAPDWMRLGSTGGARRTRRLVESLEAVTGSQVLLLEAATEGVELPEQIDLLPHNGHPNLDGLRLYARLTARALRPHLPARAGAAPPR